MAASTGGSNYLTSTNNKPFTPPSSIASASNETQSLKEGFRRIPWIPDNVYGASIYSRLFPNGEVNALKIRGPGGGGLAFTNTGQVKIHTGPRLKRDGPGSGNIGIRSYGSTIMVADQGFSLSCGKREPFEEAGCQIDVAGDSKEEVLGTKFIRAEKIILDADNIEIRGNGIQLVCGDDGAGSLDIAAGEVNKLIVNETDTVVGQKLTNQIGEESKNQFDIRGQTSDTTSGAVGQRSVGDQQNTMVGVLENLIGGTVGQLVKDRSYSMKLRTLLGNSTVESAVGLTNVSGTLVFLN